MQTITIDPAIVEAVNARLNGAKEAAKALMAKRDALVEEAKALNKEMRRLEEEAHNDLWGVLNPIVGDHEDMDYDDKRGVVIINEAGDELRDAPDIVGKIELTPEQIEAFKAKQEAGLAPYEGLIRRLQEAMDTVKELEPQYDAAKKSVNKEYWKWVREQLNVKEEDITSMHHIKEEGKEYIILRNRGDEDCDCPNCKARRGLESLAGNAQIISGEADANSVLQALSRLLGKAE